jgi:hypothetical protein
MVLPGEYASGPDVIGNIRYTLRRFPVEEDDAVTDKDQMVLHVLRLRGLAREEAVVAATGLDPVETAERLAALAEKGLVKHRAAARMPGWTLTPDGKREHAARVVDARPEVEVGYTAFLPHNVAFKELCTDWQMREGAPNDHTDAAYDAAVVERLGVLHGEICPVTAGVADGVPRFAGYAPRFTAALARVRAGEVAAFARPLADSYHDVWMELHQDLLLTLGRERGDGDGH